MRLAQMPVRSFVAIQPSTECIFEVNVRVAVLEVTSLLINSCLRPRELTVLWIGAPLFTFSMAFPVALALSHVGSSRASPPLAKRVL